MRLSIRIRQVSRLRYPEVKSPSVHLSIWKVSSAISFRSVGCAAQLLFETASSTRFSHSSFAVSCVTRPSALFFNFAMFIVVKLCLLKSGRCEAVTLPRTSTTAVLSTAFVAFCFRSPSFFFLLLSLKVTGEIEAFWAGVFEDGQRGDLPRASLQHKPSHHSTWHVQCVGLSCATPES